VKLKTLLIVPVVVLVAGYGAAKGYIYFSAKNELDNMIAMAAPFAQVSYGGISSDLRGKLTVTHLDILSLAGGETMQIQAVELKGPGPGFLFDLANGFKNGEPPRNLSLAMKGVSVPVDQGFSARVGANAMGGAAGSGQPSKSCTLAGFFQRKGLQQTGVDTLVADVQLGFDLDQDIGRAELFFDYQIDDIETFSMSMELVGVQSPTVMTMGVLPRLANFDLTYQLEPVYSSRLNEYCAKQNDKEPEAFVQSLFDISDDEYARQMGFIPGKGIRSVMKKLVSRGGALNVTANPPGDINPAQLQFYTPEDIISMLGLEVSLDNRIVEDLSLAFQSDSDSPSWVTELSALASPGETAQPEQLSGNDRAGQGAKKQNRKKPRLSYQDTRVSDLHKYVGSRVRLYTSNATKPKKGFLVSLKAGLASVEQSVHSGTMTAHLHLNDISRAEVLRSIEAASLVR
jgi:hypothetical protein